MDFSKKYYLQCVASIGFGLNIDVFASQESNFEKNAKSVFSMINFLILEMFPTLGDITALSIINKNFSSVSKNNNISLIKTKFSFFVSIYRSFAET